MNKLYRKIGDKYFKTEYNSSDYNDIKRENEELKRQIRKLTTTSKCCSDPKNMRFEDLKHCRLWYCSECHSEIGDNSMMG